MSTYGRLKMQVKQCYLQNRDISEFCYIRFNWQTLEISVIVVLGAETGNKKANDEG